MDLFKEGNDVSSSHLVLMLLFSLFFSVGMLPLRAREEKSPAVVGRHRYSLSYLRLTKPINPGVRRSPSDKKWTNSIANSNTKCFHLAGPFIFIFAPIFKNSCISGQKERRHL